MTEIKRCKDCVNPEDLDEVLKGLDDLLNNKEIIDYYKEYKKYAEIIKGYIKYLQSIINKSLRLKSCITETCHTIT